jgi:hypothetical protein
MSDNNQEKQSPTQQQPATPKEQPKPDSKPTELPKPNQGETVTKGG